MVNIRIVKNKPSSDKPMTSILLLMLMFMNFEFFQCNILNSKKMKAVFEVCLIASHMINKQSDVL